MTFMFSCVFTILMALYNKMKFQELLQTVYCKNFRSKNKEHLELGLELGSLLEKACTVSKCDN